MKVNIYETESTDLDEKIRIAKSIGATEINIIRGKRTDYKTEKLPSEPREGYFRFQTDIFKQWNDEWEEMIKDIKKDITRIIDGTN